MKRIIELPDKVVEAIQNGEDYRYDIHTAIAQSTPYNPTGDLISRSALKTELEVYRHTRNYKSDEDEAQNALLDNILEDIDNAPTVEYTFEEAFQKTVCEQRLYCPKRQQGKWIFRKGVTCGGYYKCNKCGEVERAEKNYCPNCGALMKGGAE